MTDKNFTVLGAGVIGLTTALVLREQYPETNITILASHFPGDSSIEYTSPWAGGNWCSAATDNDLLQSFDRDTFHRFKDIARTTPEAGIQSSPLRMIFDAEIEEAGILGRGANKPWYEDLVGGVRWLDRTELPEDARFGCDLDSTFVINVPVYLEWLFKRCQEASINFRTATLSHIDDVPSSTAIFNCTGLGSLKLGGVEDEKLYPSRGQTVIVAQPTPPLKTMYLRSPSRVNNDVAYVFQRPLNGGVVLGGCRQDGNWDENPDPVLADQIIKRCCKLAPELGKPEDLKVLSHGVGRRPGRTGGPRIEVEKREGRIVVHNYGASGTGFQASWGMAAHAVSLMRNALARRTSYVSKL